MRSSVQRARFERLRRLSDQSAPALTIRYGRRYLLRYPDHGPAWVYVGIALVEVGRYEDAEQAYAKAIEFCPPKKLSIPTAEMGHLFRAAGDYERAATWYRQAVELDPNDAGNHIYLGAVLATGGRLHEAEEAHRLAIQCRDGCIDEAYLNLGFVLRARERFAEAAECFRAAIRIDPDYQSARVALRDVERCIRLERHRR